MIVKLDSFGRSKGGSRIWISSFRSTHCPPLLLQMPRRRELSHLLLSLQNSGCFHQKMVAVRKVSGRRKWEWETIVPQVRLRWEVGMTCLLHFHLNANHMSIDNSELGCLSALHMVFSAHEALLMLQALSSMSSSPSPSSVDFQVTSSGKHSPTTPRLFNCLIHSTYHSW